MTGARRAAARSRRIAALVGAVLAALAMAACSLDDPGDAGRPGPANVPEPVEQPVAAPSAQPGPAPPAPVEPVTDDAVVSLPLSADDVGGIVGVVLGVEDGVVDPAGPVPLVDHRECAVLFGMNAESLDPVAFTAFRGVGQQDDDVDPDHVVFQRVAGYPDAEIATRAFHGMYGSVQGCDTAVVRDSDDGTDSWELAVAPVAADATAATWSRTQLTDGKRTAWRCTYRAGVKNNVVTEVQVCQFGSGAPEAAAIADQIGAKFHPAVPPTPVAAQYVSPGRIGALLVSAADLGGIVGAPLPYRRTYPLPPKPAGLGAQARCGVLLGMDADSYGTHADWTAYRRVRSEDSADDRSDHIVNQDVAGYVDTDTAARRFHDAFAAVAACHGAVVRTATMSDHDTWQLGTAAVADDAARWTNTYRVDGVTNTWQCAFDVRTHSNVVVQVKTCQWSDPARVTAAIADRMTSWLPA